MNFIWILSIAILVPMLAGVIMAILIEWLEEKEGNV